MTQMTEKEAYEFLGVVFKGEHHIPGVLKPFGQGWIIHARAHGLSTFDFDYLTRLVLHAHDSCVRVEIMGSGPGRVAISIHRRTKRDGSMFEKHPTIDQAIAQWRERHPVPECSVPQHGRAHE